MGKAKPKKPAQAEPLAQGSVSGQRYHENPDIHARRERQVQRGSKRHTPIRGDEVDQVEEKDANRFAAS